MDSYRNIQQSWLFDILSASSLILMLLNIEGDIWRCFTHDETGHELVRWRLIWWQLKCKKEKKKHILGNYELCYSKFRLSSNETSVFWKNTYWLKEWGDSLLQIVLIPVWFRSKWLRGFRHVPASMWSGGQKGHSFTFSADHLYDLSETSFVRTL